MGITMGRDSIPVHINAIAHDALVGSRASSKDSVDDAVYSRLRKMCQSQTDGPGVVLCLTNNLRSPQWRPVVKTLLVIHRLLRDLGKPFLDGYTSFLDASMISHVPDMPHFADDASDRGTVLVRTYSRFLHLRLEAFREPARYDPHLDGGRRHGSLRAMTVVELLKVLPRVTRLLQGGTHIPLDANTLSLPLAQQVLSLALLDIFQCSLDVMDGLHRVSECIFDLECGGQRARIALRLAQDALATLEGVAIFYKKCKALSPSSEFPPVTVLPPALLKRMQQWAVPEGGAEGSGSQRSTGGAPPAAGVPPPHPPSSLGRMSPPGSEKKVNRSLTDEFDDNEAAEFSTVYTPPSLPLALPPLDPNGSDEGYQASYRVPPLPVLGPDALPTVLHSPAVRAPGAPGGFEPRYGPRFSASSAASSNSAPSSRASDACPSLGDVPHGDNGAAFFGFNQGGRLQVSPTLSGMSTPTMVQGASGPLELMDPMESDTIIDAAVPSAHAARLRTSESLPRSHQGSMTPRAADPDCGPLSQRGTPNGGLGRKPPVAPLLRHLMQKEERSPSAGPGAPTPTGPASQTPVRSLPPGPSDAPSFGAYASPYNTLNAGGEGSGFSPSAMPHAQPIFPLDSSYPPPGQGGRVDAAPLILIPADDLSAQGPPSGRAHTPRASSQTGLYSSTSLPGSSGPSMNFITAYQQSLNSPLTRSMLESGSFTSTPCYSSGGRHSLSNSQLVSPRLVNPSVAAALNASTAGAVNGNILASAATAASLARDASLTGRVASSPYSAYAELPMQAADGLATLTLSEASIGPPVYGSLSRDGSGRFRREHDLADSGVRAYTIGERVYSVMRASDSTEGARAYPPASVVIESIHPNQPPRRSGSQSSMSSSQYVSPHKAPPPSQSPSPMRSDAAAKPSPAAAALDRSAGSGGSGRATGPPAAPGPAATYPAAVLSGTSSFNFGTYGGAGGSASSKEAFPTPAKRINQQKEEQRRKEEEARRKEEERRRKEEGAKRIEAARKAAELERARLAALAARRALEEEARSYGLEPLAYAPDTSELRVAVTQCRASVATHGREQGALLFCIGEIRAAMAQGAGHFINFVHRRFKPMKDGAGAAPEPVNPADQAAVRRAIKKALIDYHPDRNVRHGDTNWSRLCNELTIALNQSLA